MSQSIEEDSVARSKVLLTWGLSTVFIMSALSGCPMAAFSLQLTPAQKLGRQPVRGCRHIHGEGRG